MREANGHLTIEDILLMLRPGPGEDRSVSLAELQAHLDRCTHCAKIKEQYQRLMPELDLFRTGGTADFSECPQAEIWIQLAARIVPQEQAVQMTRHAATCKICATKLAEALELVGIDSPPPAELRQSLKSGTKEWQANLAKQMALRTGYSPAQKSTADRTSFIFAHRQALGYSIAAVCLIAAGIALFLRVRPPSTDELLAKAYGHDRTIELRLPQSHYGPFVGEERGGVSGKSEELTEAELRIARDLKREPENLQFLRQRAEADLLGNAPNSSQAIIDRLRPLLKDNSADVPLLIDLGIAYFQRAEKTEMQADYEDALNYLNPALRLSPYNPAALFNRAIVHERMQSYGSAIADWELFLQKETDPGWRKEAENHLKNLRSKPQQHRLRGPPLHLTPEEFENSLASGQSRDAEEYILFAERTLLPSLSAGPDKSQNLQLALELTEYFDRFHSDRFLGDLLRSSGLPRFQAAARLLGEASIENEAGHSERAYTKASEAAALFKQMGNRAGEFSARFEQVYALQFEGEKSTECARTAAEIQRDAQQQGYIWIEAQALIEQAICSNMQGEVSKAKLLTQAAIRLSQEHGYKSFYLRALANLCRLESEAGDESRAWALLREGLAQYWSSNVPGMRAYTFYVLMDRMAEHLGHPNVQFSANFEALQFISGGPDQALEASERSRLANAALLIGDTATAEQQWSLACSLFAAAPPEPSGKWREIEARIHLISAQSRQGRNNNDAISSLLAYSSLVKEVRNRYVEIEYYATLAELQLKAGKPTEAEQALVTAIAESDKGLSSLRTWHERLTWTEQARKLYLLLVEIRFRSGHEHAAWELWQHFRTASSLDTQILNKSLPAGSKVLTYAIASDRLILWIRDQQEFHSAFVSVTADELKRTVANFMDECARSDSDPRTLRNDAKLLYSWLIQPVAGWLPSAGHVVIEGDAILELVPFEALIDTSDTYLGERFTFAIAASSMAGGQFPSRIQSSDPTLIVAAPVAPDLDPPAGAAAESRSISDLFSHHTILPGREATLQAVQREITRNSVFHFAGHGAVNRTGAAMRLADGNLGISGKQTESVEMMKKQAGTGSLQNLKLAVFSACATARQGEISPSDSLPAEFLQAGVQAVVASRWNVNSPATRDFMILFYRAALSGQSVAEALQTAARSFRKTPERAHPYFWAAFGHFGNV